MEEEYGQLDEYGQYDDCILTNRKYTSALYKKVEENSLVECSKRCCMNPSCNFWSFGRFTIERNQNIKYLFSF